MKKIILIVSLLIFTLSCIKTTEKKNEINDFPYLESDINYIQKGYKEGILLAKIIKLKSKSASGLV